MDYGRYSANPLFDNNRCPWLLEQLDSYMRIEVDDGDKGQVFYVSVLVDDIPIAEIIDDIVDPQGQGRIVESLVNAAGDVVDSIHPCEGILQKINQLNQKAQVADLEKFKYIAAKIAPLKNNLNKLDANENYYFDRPVPERDFSKLQLCMRLIAKWEKPRIKMRELFRKWEKPRIKMRELFRKWGKPRIN